MDHPGSPGWGLNPITTVLIRDRTLGHVKTKGEIGVMWPQTKGCLEPPEPGRDKAEFSLTDIGGSTTWLTT